MRLTPNAGRNSVDGIQTAADGESLLRARVTAVPQDGKANKALILLLADTLRIPKSSISILSGETVRKKNPLDHGRPGGFKRKIQDCLERLKAYFCDW